MTNHANPDHDHTAQTVLSSSNANYKTEPHCPADIYRPFLNTLGHIKLIGYSETYTLSCINIVHI